MPSLLRSRAPLAVGLLAALAASGCRPGPTLTYRVHVSETTPRETFVELELNRLAAGETVTLRSFASTSDSRAVDLRAFDGSGDTLAVAELGGGDGAASPTRFAFQAPSSGRAVVRYRVWLSGRYGNANEGFERFRTASVNDRFALLRGRDLFLVREPPEGIAEAAVSFHLPEGWGAWAPWAPGGTGETPVERRGRDAIEEMVAAPLALGRFHATRSRVGKTEFHLIAESGIPDGARAAVRADMEAAIHAVAREVALGEEYVALVVPRTPDGDEVEGDAWSSGQGATLYPLTNERLRKFARQLLAARLGYPPRQIVFRDPADAWVPVGLRERLSLDVVAEVRGIGAGAVDRFLSHAYATLPGDGREFLDLERVFTDPTVAPESRQLAAARVAPLAIRALEREVGGAAKFRAWLRGYLSQASAGSFWSALPLPPEKRARLRAVWGRGAELMPIDFGNERSEIAQGPSAAPSAAPANAPAAAARSVRIAFTSQSLGYIENCGCKANQSGGLARRSALFRRLRGEDVPLLLVDAGSGHADPGLRADPDAFQLAEEGIYQRLVAGMDYAALAPGHTDLSGGVAAFDAARGHLPYVSANVHRLDGSPVAPAFRTISLGGIRCHVIGVYAPWNPFHWPSSFEEAMQSLRIEDPAAAVRRVASSLPEKDLVVVAGEIPYPAIREIARSAPNVDVILASPQIFLGELAPRNAGGTSQNDWPGFLGRTAVAYGDLGSYGVTAVRLALDGEGRVTNADFERYELNDAVPEDPSVRATLNAFYAGLGSATSATAHVKSPAAALASDPTGWVGAAACADCHESETEQWRATPHATAMRTLTKVYRDKHPKCVSCHVVGFGAEDGYRIGGKTEHLAGVQCEACHGPGRAHAAAPSAANIARRVPEGVCVACHDVEHSEAFDYARRVPLVDHDSKVAAMVRPHHDPHALPAARIVKPSRKEVSHASR